MSAWKGRNAAMAHKLWTFQLEDGVHRVELDHNYWSGNRTITVDGNVIEKATQKFYLGGDYQFRIRGHSGVVQIISTGIAYMHNLVVDNQVISAGQQLSPPILPSKTWAEYPPDHPISQARAGLEQERRRIALQLKSGANWFYLIGALTTINAVLLIFKANGSFA